MTEINFKIENWSGWSPNLRKKEDWESLANNPDKKITSQETDIEESPSLDFITQRTQRRYSQLTKMSLKTTQDILDNAEKIPSVFASRFGEYQKTIKLIDSINNNEVLSPAAFSLSVHNTAAGVFSLTNKNKKLYTSVSAGNKTFETGLIEAISKLTLYNKILYVIGDEKISTKNEENIIKIPYSFAFLITNDTQNKNEKTKDNKFLTLSTKNTHPADAYKKIEENSAFDFIKWYIIKNNKHFKLTKNIILKK